MSKTLVPSVLLLLLAVANVQSKTYKFPPLFDQRSWIENPSAGEEKEDDNLNYRLPNQTIPLNYEVHITTRVHEKEENFTGTVKITIQVVEDTKNITLHARKLNIRSAALLDSNETIECDFTDPNNPREFLVVIPKDKRILKKGKEFILEIKYDGKLRKDNHGFYISTYKDDSGNEKWLATTQFESTDARHAFPCYDEPAKRATFEFSLTHGKNYTAISNTNAVGNPVTIPGTDLVTTTFRKTEKMSTYITAFIVSDFVHTEAEYRGLKQRVYSRPNTINHQEFALTSATQLIGALDDYFGVKYKTMLPDEKLEQVAIPDFAAGAMENWGLTTYREEYLLYEEGKSSVQTKTNIANVLGHEDVHQWFGDYVAIEWWTYLWLKESFAEYFSYVSNDIVYPSWNIYQLYLINEYQRGMQADSGLNPRPMTHYVQKPNEISALYDSISYAKGSAILRMWSHALSEDVFRSGLNKHLKERAYKSAVEEQLFSNIQKAAQAQNFKVPAKIDEMMGSWTRQGGHPLLTVKRNYADGSFTISQTQYFDDPTVKSNRTFYVPFNYAKGSAPDFQDTLATHYLSGKSVTVNDAKLAKNEFLIVNKQSTGFYHVQYDTDNWKLITKALLKRHFKIHVLNRASLIYDLYKLCSARSVNYDILLDLLSYLEAEDDYAPWATAHGILNNFLFYLQEDEKTLNNLKLFIRQITDRIFDKLGVADNANERHLDRYLRSNIMNLACRSGDESCLKATSEKLENFVENNIPIEANLKAQVICNGLREADGKTFDKVFEYMIASDDAAERRTMIQTLGCTQEKENIRKFVRSSLDEKRYKNNEQNEILYSVYTKGVNGLEASIEFLEERYADYYKLTPGFTGQNRLEFELVSMPTYIISKKTNDSYFNLLKKIRADPTIKLKDGIEKRSEAVIKSNMDWGEKHKPQISKWLSRYALAQGGAGQMTASILTITTALFLSKLFM